MRTIFLSMALSLIANITYCTDYYVNASTGSDVLINGTSENPWKTITYALSCISGSGHTVHVSAGIYNTDLGETFPIMMVDGVSLSGFGIDMSIIDAQSSGMSVFKCIGIIDVSTKLEGFTIRGGAGSEGGGLYISAGSILNINNNKITANTATNGSGIYITNATPLITNNLISSNGSYCIYITSSSPVIKGNTITNNSTHSLHITGSTSSPGIINNVIAKNTDDGIYCEFCRRPLKLF